LMLRIAQGKYPENNLPQVRNTLVSAN